MANAWGTPASGAQSQYNTLSQQLNQMENSGMQDSSAYRTLRSQRDGLVPQLQSSATSGGSGAGGVGTAWSNWANALKNTEGRGDAVMSDPYTQAALDRFKGVLGGQDVPYTDQVQSQLLARQADAGAASGAAQASMLRDSMSALGGSMADPQAQAAMRQIQAQLQQQNNGNLGDMQSKATLANFGARNDAASSLAATRNSQLGMANSQYNQASQLYANQQLAGPHQNGVAGGPPPTQGSGQSDYEKQMAAYQDALKQWKDATQGQGAQAPGMTAQSGGPPSGGYATNSGGQPGMQLGGGGNWTGNTTPDRPYNNNGVNAVTGVPQGTGYVQLSGQPNTRINYGNAGAGYNPNLPVY